MATTVNFYPHASAGHIRRYEIGWAYTHDLADGYAESVSPINVYARWMGGGGYAIARALLAFDTGNIPDEANIISATLKFNVTRNDYANKWFAVGRTVQASPTALVNGDYSRVLPEFWDHAQINGTGLKSIGVDPAWIIKNWWTRLSIRDEEYDILNKAPDEYGQSLIQFEGMGYGNPPYLEVVYSTPPTAPSGLTTGLLNTLTPTLAWTHNDPDSDAQAGYQIIAETAGGTQIWDSGDITSATASAAWNGSALAWGTSYRFKVRTRDAVSGWGPYSGYSTFTTNSVPSAPTGLAPTGAAIQHTLTPTLSWTHVDVDGNAQAYYQLVVETAAGAGVYDTGAVASASGSRVYDGGALSWGTAYRFKVRTHDNVAGWGAYSAWSYFTTNYPPTAPTGLLAEGATNPGNIQDGTPEFSAIYNDPDASDIAQYYQIQVATDAGFASVVWDSTKTGMSNLTAGSRCPDVAYGTTALAADGKRYYWRIKFWDDDGVEGAWSAAAWFDMDCTVHVRIETDTAGDPSGTAVNNGTKTLYLSDLSDAVSWVAFVFATAPNLTGSTAYHLVLKVVGLDNLVNKRRLVWRHNTAGAYADGIRKTSVDAGTNWTDYAAHDMAFKEYSGATADQTADVDVDYYPTYT